MISLSSPVETTAHRWPAGAKLGALAIATIVLFAINHLSGQAVILAFVLLLYTLPGWIFFTSGIKKLRGLWPFVLVVLIWHMFDQTIAKGLVIVMRMISAVALANLVTMTTRLSDMIQVFRHILTPFRRFGLETRSFEIAIALVIRMTPTLLDNAGNLATAWRARAIPKPNWRIILPFSLMVLDDADHLAEALKARGGVEK